MAADSDSLELLHDGPAGARATLVLAHGAGAPMDSEFMVAIAAGVAAHRIAVVRFEFPYMAARRCSGRRRAADRMPVLQERFRTVVAALGDPKQLVLGGKSLGGRVASLLVDELGARGLCCLGYPFHPPGKPQTLRTEHLQTLQTPALIVQGERDPFGTPDEVEAFQLPPTVRLCWLPDGDHSFKPRVRSGHTLEQNLERAVGAVVEFLAELR